jgi:hypothetical protein
MVFTPQADGRNPLYIAKAYKTIVTEINRHFIDSVLGLEEFLFVLAYLTMGTARACSFFAGHIFSSNFI